MVKGAWTTGKRGKETGVEVSHVCLAVLWLGGKGGNSIHCLWLPCIFYDVLSVVLNGASFSLGDM